VKPAPRGEATLIGGAHLPDGRPLHQRAHAYRPEAESLDAAASARSIQRRFAATSERLQP
jgi:hypothetical protein